MVRKLLLSLVAAITILAMMVPGCYPPDPCHLTMAVAPLVGGTATDLTDSSPYAADTVVDIQAVAAPCYRFVNWTAPAGTFADANAATTTFTMPARDVTVTANFERIGLDHFTVYDVDGLTAPVIEKVVYLEDQFGAVNAMVWNAVAFCNPAEKLHGDVLTPISNPDHHLTMYMIGCEEEPQTWEVDVDNQFGPQHLTVWGPVGLGVPTQKEDHEAPVCLDHFLVYLVIEGPSIEEVVYLQDQFGDHPEVMVYEPIYFANPVKKTHGDDLTEIVNPEAHVVIYGIEGEPLEKRVDIDNQFGDGQILDLSGPNYIAVPSEKLSFGAVLDHFKGYGAEDTAGLSIEQEVYLEDQFGALDATVEYVSWFCNPAGKIDDGTETWIWNPDHHLTVYGISYEGGPRTWEVDVDNQFGTQHLTVSGPVALVVPTQKDGHNPPVGLDHFLLYEVILGEPVTRDVQLWDQFNPAPEWVVVDYPLYFANPVKKIHGNDVTEIVNPLAHLVFYQIWAGPFEHPLLPVDNQFGEQTLDVYNPAFLCVPSLKLNVDPID